jgi:hypothetical protein
MNSRRYPRTLQEAFGPYTRAEFVEERWCLFQRLWLWITGKL